jgi:predicted ATP-dependent endonuclease of OLD family
MMQRPEVLELKARFEEVLRLFRPDPEHPDRQAQEIRELEDRINSRLNEIIGGIVSIETTEPDIRPVLLPSTVLVLQDREDSVKTPVKHQGHGLIMTLLQILAEVQTQPGDTPEGEPIGFPRPIILAIEEPELYMHPQMQRKMRDTLYRIAGQPGIQVICTTHSPVFLDMGHRHKAIIRAAKDINRLVTFSQVTADLFDGPTAAAQRERLRLVAHFHPTVNEVFFAKRVVLLEEQSAVVAFERAAELTGLFDRHPQVHRDVTLIDAQGKGNILLFQKVLNHFSVPYTVIYDEDQGNPQAAAENAAIEELLPAAHGLNRAHKISPTNLEGLLGYVADKNKVYRALKRVEEIGAAAA